MNTNASEARKPRTARGAFENLQPTSRIRELGPGRDSFAFMDDPDHEHEQMRQLMPEVLILNESGDPRHILRSLWETGAFESLVISDEDRQRHQD